MEASVLTEYYGRSIRADLGVNSLVLLWDSMAKKKKKDKTGKVIHKASGGNSEPGGASAH